MVSSMKIPLCDWASKHYSPPPSNWTLRRWAREGRIYPAPEKVGKSYYVEEDAQLLTEQQPSLVSRLRAA